MDGKVYYAWDRNYNGHGGGADVFTEAELNTIFAYDVNGAPETLGNAVGAVGQTDSTFRYATINGVHIALPTYGGPVDAATGNAMRTSYAANGTAVEGFQNNPTYDDLLAIWDSFNGTGTDTLTSGWPPAWRNQLWAATQDGLGHQSFDLLEGYVYSAYPSFVAVQVL